MKATLKQAPLSEQPPTHEKRFWTMQKVQKQLISSLSGMLTHADFQLEEALA